MVFFIQIPFHGEVIDTLTSTESTWDEPITDFPVFDSALFPILTI